MTIACTGFMVGDFLCYRCMQSGGHGLFVFIENGNTDDEQYICAACADEVTAGDPLGRLQLLAVTPKPGSTS